MEDSAKLVKDFMEKDCERVLKSKLRELERAHEFWNLILENIKPIHPKKECK